MLLKVPSSQFQISFEETMSYQPEPMDMQFTVRKRIGSSSESNHHRVVPLLNQCYHRFGSSMAHRMNYLLLFAVYSMPQQCYQHRNTSKLLILPCYWLELNTKNITPRSRLSVRLIFFKGISDHPP